MVGQRTLNPFILVRIQARQPFDSLRSLMAIATFIRNGAVIKYLIS